MGNPVVHWELWSKDPAKVSGFYEKVFDWKIQHIPEMDYRLADPGGEGGIGGGIMKPQEGPWPGNMSLYIDVANLAAHRKRITDAGGKIVVEEMVVPNMGKFSLFADPDGRVMGIWERAPKAG
jgi:predicted enzyme related to lactoylglutathione lyase